MNRHLNLFRAFSQEQSKENIEDNLSRALVLCLKHNDLFFHEFIQTILLESKNQEDYDYLFANPSEKDQAEIDIQIDVTTLNENEFKRIYAISVTTENLSMLDFFNYSFNGHKKYTPITDIFISINDIAFVFEVKRWGEDCRQQLYNQIFKLTTKDQKEDSKSIQQIPNQEIVVPLSLDWKRIMTLATIANNFCNIVNSPNQFLKDFIGLVQSFNTNWLPITPFASIPNTPNMDAKRNQRLIAAINNVPEFMEPLNYNDRSGFGVNFGWAKEILPYFERDSKGNLSLNVYIWPGNTKGQGWKVFYSEKVDDLYNNKEVVINGKPFQLKIEHEIKFSHFNRYVSELDFKSSDTLLDLVTTENFEKYSGKYNREEWPKLEAFFDNHFKKEFNWREVCKWDEKFVNTNRNYLTLSIGYQISTIIPYDYLQEIDKKEKDLDSVSNLFVQVYDFYKNLL